MGAGAAHWPKGSRIEKLLTARYAPERVAAEQPNWASWREAWRVVAHPPFLKKTLGTALIVGSVLFAINHLDEVLRGRATMVVWIKGALTTLVPFCVSNVGILIATRRRGGGPL